METSNSRIRKTIPVVATVLLILILVPLLMIAWMQSRGDWQLSATNSPSGVVIDVFWGDAMSPRYSTTLAGKTIPRNIDRVIREDLPPDIGVTTFYDVTLRPGRWTVVMDGVELDIMEAGWDIDGKPATPPRNTTEPRHAAEPE